jgi:hypothetical protein
MYTAPKNVSEDQLNEECAPPRRRPLALARQSLHATQAGTVAASHPEQFGFAVSISTQDACEQEGGRFIPQVVNLIVYGQPVRAAPTRSGRTSLHVGVECHYGCDSAAPLTCSQYISVANSLGFERAGRGNFPGSVF